MKKVLITGNNSFIGKRFIKMFDDSEYLVDAVSLRNDEWKLKNFQDYDAIIHVAAIVHKNEKEVKYEVYDRVNYHLAIEVARKAKEEGVKQFIFLSTMSVYGLNVGYITANTSLNPISLYARSKLAAEQSLQNMNSQDYKVAIVRPPMVYGDTNKGNYSILRKIALSTPIFPKIENERSAIYVDNLCEFLKVVIDTQMQGIFFPQNEHYMSTSETVSLIAKAHSKKVYQSKLLALAIQPLMFSSTLKKAFGSLTYDLSMPGGPNNLEYNKVSFDESIKKSAQMSNSNYQKPLVLQRPLDILFSATGLVVASPLLIGAVAIGYLDTGSPLFVQERVGKDQKPFKLIKFRTMKVNTESVASHLVDNTSITKLGKILRKTKLDELPQLINVLKGEMSLVGPRPNLFNQKDLIEARDKIGVYEVLPGITGLAQLSGIDMSTPERLAKKDKEMIDTINLKNYFSYILSTALGKGSGDAVK